MERVRSTFKGQWRWLTVTVVVAGLLVCAATFARAQSRSGENFTIIHVDPQAFSHPLPVLSTDGGTIQPGAIYELYFTGGLYVPALGVRDRLFVRVRDVSTDGWIRVEYGDDVIDRGSDTASLVAVELSNDVVPHTAVQWRVHYTSIAALSPRLNSTGPMAQYWPD